MYRILTEQEAKDTYPDLFKSAFGYWDDRQMPGVILVREEKGQVISFLSGYLRSTIEFYIQYLGVIHEKKARGWGVRFVLDGLIYLQEHKNIKWVSCATENTNFSMMRILLSCKFIPHGIQVSAKGKTYIQWMREVNNGNSIRRS